MSATPSLFLWDIDGTIMRGGTDVHRAAFAHAYRAVYGRNLTLDGVVAAGRTDRWLLAEPLRRDGMPEDDIARSMPRAFAVMEEYVEAHIGDLRDRVLPGIPETLATLHARGHLQALLTGNLRRIALLKMRMAGLERYFDTGAFGEESAVRADLVPVALTKAAERAGAPIPPRRAIVIGDTALDVEAGRTHGTRTVVVATGLYSVENLQGSGADLLLPSFEDVEDAAGRLEALLEPDAQRPASPPLTGPR